MSLPESMPKVNLEGVPRTLEKFPLKSLHFPGISGKVQTLLLRLEIVKA